MIMTNTKPCRTCIYGEKWSGVYTCGRAFEKDGTINQGRIPTRTENKCFGYIKKGTRKMNAIIVDKDKKEGVKTVENTVEKPVESVEKSDDKPKKHKWTDEDIQTLIHFYNKGTKSAVLADMFGVTRTNINNKIYELKQSERWGEYFTDSGTSKTETLPEPETLVSEKRKVYKANGIGFISVDGSMKIDDTPITAELAKAISDSGLKQFYGEIEIKIKPIQPTGITVSVEEE